MLNAMETEALMQAYRKRMAERSRAAGWQAFFWLGGAAVGVLFLVWMIFLR
jgi:hypothetical protein